MSGKVRGLPVKLALLLFTATAAYLHAQEEQPLDETPLPEVTVQVLTPEQNRIDMDIRTSTLSELAAWCRSLGLSEGGTSADLARRLRDYYEILENTSLDEDNRKIITIQSARTSEYFTIEAVDEEYARLSGEVKLTLKDGDAIHEIQAWDILFNRTRNILTASGGVVYVRTEGDKIETFRGDSITVDIDNWSSIFLGGVSERSLQSDDTTYQFAGTVISRDEEDVVVLKKATISSANNEESLWSLKATRVWLLPGSDFAVFNAVLKVGEIPVMYIPFFYYPADEVIFHPVIGYRTREGNFVQTTTYILGRPKASSSSQSSLTKILGNSNDMEKKREGLFLRSTGKKAVDKEAISLKAIVDYYSNLGAYIGSDLDLPGKEILGPLNLSLGIGLTRTIVNDGGSYTPFFPTYDGNTDWNSSNLFSLEVPFRYRLNTNSSIRGKYSSFTWSFPFYSDPLVDSDFLRRSEEMDWINMIQKGAAWDEEETEQNMLGSYTWQLSGNVNPSFPRISPYVTGVSLSTISSTVSFRQVDTRNNYQQDDIKRYSPSSFFFAPDTATLISLSGSIEGTPLTLGRTTAAAQTTKPELPDPLKNIGVPRSPFEDKEKEETQRKDKNDPLVPPELNQRFDIPRIGSNIFSVSYRVAPSGVSTLKFDYNKWNEFSDINWGDVSSVLTNFSGEASTTLNFNHSENLYSNSFTFSGNGTWQQYSYLNEEADEYLSASGSGVTDPEKVKNAKLQEYKQSFFSTSYGFISTLRPLYQNPIFGASNLQYSLKGLAVSSKFDEENGTADDPEWEIIRAEWNKDKVDIHQFETNFSALLMDKPQTFSLSTDLPPIDSSLAWRTALRIWITETDANMRILFPGEADKRKLEPFNFTERLIFGTFGSFSQNLVLDTEKRELTTLTSTLNLSKWGLGFTMAYSASRMRGYEYIPPDSGAAATGWVQRTEDERLQSRDFSINFSYNLDLKEIWNKRLDFTFNTSSRLFLDLQRYTSSNFTFSLGFILKINKFLDLAMSTNSENASIYRYMKDWAFFKDAPIDIPDGPQNNVFRDFFNSFRFDDEELRRSSGFKIKNFQISATHYLGDWNAVLNWTMSPYRPTNSRRYEISNEVSFLVQWVPISEFKSDISYNKRNDPEWRVQGFGN